MLKYTSKGERSTERLGERIGSMARPGLILTLRGDLGAGKTVLARGVARGLGIEGPVTSPTFTLLNQLSGRFPFYHFDLYRLDDADEIYELGFEEFINGDGVAVIEWPENMDYLHPNEYVDIYINKAVDDEIRDIKIEIIGDSFKWLEKGLLEYVSASY